MIDGALAAAALSGAGDLAAVWDALEQAPRDRVAVRGAVGVEAVVAARPPAPARAVLPPAVLEERILGAWLGRCAGCTLGKPVEIWQRAAIRRYLERDGRLSAARLRAAAGPRRPAPAAEHLLAGVDPRADREMPRDDDIDYTILGLHLLETHGHRLTAEDVGEAWLRLLPFRADVHGGAGGLSQPGRRPAPPATATTRNPYREWIGAQIRADAYGYVSPGDRRGAALARRRRRRAVPHGQRRLWRDVGGGARGGGLRGADMERALEVGARR